MLAPLLIWASMMVGCGRVNCQTECLSELDLLVEVRQLEVLGESAGFFFIKMHLIEDIYINFHPITCKN